MKPPRLQFGVRFLLAALSLFVPAPAHSQDDLTTRPDSIEAALERARMKRDEIQARLKPEVLSLVRELEEIAGRSTRTERRILRDVAALGPEARPLLLPYLDPGLPKKQGTSYRAARIAHALADAPSDVLTPGLIQLSTEATPEGRRLAIYVLGHQPPDPRIDQHLEKLFYENENVLRLECVRSLALRGGHRELLSRTLSDSDPEILSAVLKALTARRAEWAAGAVSALLTRPRTAGQILDELTGYYLSCPNVVDQKTLVQLLALLLKEEIDAAARIKLLDAVPSFTKSLDLKERRLIEPILESRNSELREAGLVCMALLGHRPAKRELIKHYTKQVESHGGWPKAYEDRADMYLRIRELSLAIKDYKRSIEELGERAFLVSYRDLWMKLARAYVGSGKLRQAFETLNEFGLGPEMRKRILADPAFAPLVDSRYGRSLR